MTIHKLTAADGYTYLTRHVVGGDVDREPGQSAADYYTAEGNPAGRWLGRGIDGLGLAAGDVVSEAQMRALFGRGRHPDAERIIAEYMAEYYRPDLTQDEQDQLAAGALAQASLGMPYPQYATLAPFADRVTRRLAAIREQTGRDPTAAEVARVQRDESARPRQAVAGYDLVFTPVKSVSLLWALHPDPVVRAAVRRAHDDAVNDVMAMLEQHAAFTRTGKGGVAQVDTFGLVAVAFDHYDSRDRDPNLHTHLVISNKIQGIDGRWRALDARGLYRLTVAASERYNTTLQALLTDRLGLRFTPRATKRGAEPVWEIDGVPTAWIATFSRRRSAITTAYAELVDQYRAAHGHDPAAATAHKLAREATLATRRDKKPPQSLAAKRASWGADLAAAHGPDAVTVLAALVPSVKADPPDHGGERAPPPPVQAMTMDEAAAEVVAAVAERRSTWTFWNLQAEAERLLRDPAIATELAASHLTVPSDLVPDAASSTTGNPAGNAVRDMRGLVDAVVAQAVSPAFSICVQAPAIAAEPARLRRADGQSVFVEHGSARYTSQAVLDAEERLLAAARATTQPVHPVTEDSVAGALAEFEARTGERLDDGQRALVTAFATDRLLLVVGLGPGGTGKTTAMRAYLHTLRTLCTSAGGRRLVPLATSAAAAAVLARELGVPADNVHKFLYEHTQGPYAAVLAAGEPVPAPYGVFQVRSGDVLLVDEAGMAGTLNLDRLVSIAARHGATVRLLGDYRQLAAVESGGALRLIATEVGAAELTTVHRFTDPAEAAATLKVRVGDSAGLDFYDDAGRIRGGSKTAMVEAAYRGWLTDIQAGVTSFMPAATNADAAALSARARADRVTAGQVEPGGVELHDGNTAGVGDWVVTRRNQRRLAMHAGRDWVRNGDPWHVVARHGDGSLRVRHLVHGGHITLPAEYVTRHVELLYATTAHRVQGGTVDTAHPLVTDAMTREHLYVTTTRARHRTILYVATHDLLPLDDDERLDHAGHDPNARAAREVLHRILAREGAERSATETIRDTQHEAESLTLLIPRYMHAVKTYSTDTESGSDVGEPVTAASPIQALSGEPVPPVGRYQYANAISQALGSRLATRAVTDPAWPALQAAIHRAHQAGHNPADVLPRVTRRRELDAAASVSATLAERITQVTTGELDPIRDGVIPSPDPVTRAAPLPWTPPLPSDAPADAGQYLPALADQIRDRTAALGRTVAWTRPAWSSVFGTEPTDAAAKDHWESSISIVAAYREYRGITDDDPAHPLGPYLEPRDPGHAAQRQAAAAVLHARRLAHPEALAAPGGPADAAGRTEQAQRPADGDLDQRVAVSVYRSLTPADRDVVLTTMITTAGNLWHHRSGGHDPATDPLHGQQLRRALIRHGHLSQAPGRRPPATTSAQSSIDPARPPGRGTTNRAARRRPSAVSPGPLTSHRRGPIATPSDRKGADRVQTPRPSPVDPRLQRPGPPPAGPTTRR